MWRVTLPSGSEIEIWADACTTDPVDGHWEFCLLVEDATPEEQQEMRIDSRTVPPSDRCTIVVARIPVADLAKIEGGWPLTQDPRSDNRAPRST